jgi:formyltetrahydrofolate-dependent phosphoribosylglycinamide formyltransferase
MLASWVKINIYSGHMAAEHLEALGHPDHVLGVLASGGGTNFVAIYEAIEDGRLPNTMIAMVISDKEKAGVRDRAQERSIPFLWTQGVKGPERDHFIVDRFRAYGVTMVIAAGYLPIVGPEILEAYENHVLNIHPVPLPGFGGKGMHGKLAVQSVLDSGARWAGPTVHLMDEGIETGQILAHRPVPVLAGDTVETLAARGLEQEYDLYWRAIAQQQAVGPHPEA